MCHICVTCHPLLLPHTPHRTAHTTLHHPPPPPPPQGTSALHHRGSAGYTPPLIPQSCHSARAVYWPGHGNVT